MNKSHPKVEEVEGEGRRGGGDGETYWRDNSRVKASEMSSSYDIK